MTAKHLSPLSDGEQERLRDALQDDGEDELAETLGISRVALLRAASGLPLMRGSRSILVQGMKALDAEEAEDDDDDDADDEDADDDEIEH